MGMKPTEHQMEEIIHELDQNRDGTIEFAEFLRVMAVPKRGSAAFKLMSRVRNKACVLICLLAMSQRILVRGFCVWHELFLHMLWASIPTWNKNDMPDGGAREAGARKQQIAVVLPAHGRRDQA